MESLTWLLDEAEGGCGMSREDLKVRLRSRWSWPLGEHHIARARGYAERPPTALGESLLLSISNADGAGGLWRLAHVPEGQAASDAFVLIAPELANSFDRLRLAAMRVLPMLARVGPLERGHWVVSPLSAVRDREAIGDSYSASIVLAWASLFMRKPVPTAVAASAVVNEKGHLTRVEGLPAKLLVLDRIALSVTRLCVSSAQEEEARAALPPGSRITIVGCANVLELLRAAFETFELPLMGRPTAQAFARSLYGLALNGRAQWIGWNGVASAAEQVEQMLDGAPYEQQFARDARAYAIRHEPGGREIPPVTWPTEVHAARLPRPVRFKAMAHAVQQAHDRGGEQLLEILADAIRRMPPKGEQCLDALALMGAVGRGLARLRRYDEAERILRGAVDGFRDSYALHDVSRSLCELLRVVGIRKDTKALDALISCCDGPDLADALAPDSKAFVAVAAGRALVQTGQPDAAIRWFGRREIASGEVAEHLLASRDRWLARAKDALGDLAGADQHRANLESAQPDDDRYEQRLLAGLDRAVRDRAGVPSALEQLLAHRGAESFKLLLTEVPDTEQLDVARNEAPY